MHEAKIYDYIGEWGVTAKDFTDAIPKDETEITVRINSLGGSVGDGLAIYNYLKDHPANVTTIVDGYAASMGSVVALAGDTRLVHKSSMIMVHQPWGMSVGNADEMREQAAVLDEHSAALISIYEDATGMSADDIKGMLDKETWMRGEAAMDFGFATDLIDDANSNTQQAAAASAFASMVAALTEGEELMSKQKTRKEIEAELTAAVELSDVNAAKVEELSGKIEEQEAQAQVKIDLAQAESDALKAETVELQAKIDAEIEAKAEVEQLVEAAKIELEGVKAEVETVKAELVAAQAALKNPAIADAMLTEAETQAKVIADAEADAAEAAALEDAPVEPKNEMEEWELMDQGAVRSEFWAKNKKKILAQIAARAEQGE